jgi:hypothetical protein
MNLYFPDAWMEQAQRVFERALVYQHTGAGEPLTPGWCSYFQGLIGDLADEYHYIVGRSQVNAGFRQNVPAWVLVLRHLPCKNMCYHERTTPFSPSSVLQEKSPCPSYAESLAASFATWRRSSPFSGNRQQRSWHDLC